jgi:hypothetical protein
MTLTVDGTPNEIDSDVDGEGLPDEMISTSTAMALNASISIWMVTETSTGRPRRRW